MTLAQLLTKWLDREGGAERANYQMFLGELAQALGVPAPNPKGQGLGDYEFEAPVRSEAVLGTKGTGRIDLYKRDCFVLEAKQSQVKPGEALPLDPPAPPPKPILDLFDNPIGLEPAEGKPPPRYDRLMADARLQAERYARALPGTHKSPPFLIVADIGRSFELYFDYSGNGRGYGAFPDERHYRIGLAELVGDRLIPGLDLTAADTLRAIWTAPASIDPRLRAAEVTRDIAVRLSRVAEALEKDQRQLRPDDAEIALGIEATSLFLMRMLFCMFAEDVELLPKDSFKQFLGEAKDKSDLFWRNGLNDLWSKMNTRDEVNRFWLAGDAVVRYFNGNLFGNTRIFDLPREFKGELHVAAGKDWRKVEPAIFGTLLEQVLTAKDLAKLGAHYTPRAYVERLVDATMMEVLRPQWEAVQAQARDLLENEDASCPVRAEPVEAPSSSGRPRRKDGPSTGSGQAENGSLQHADCTAQAIALATAFHTRVVAIRVLDPACGTGNFLYVAMEQLLRLETEVRQFVIGLGGTLDPAIHPNQFLGLELNPRAAVIAELVLWIGWLRYRLANTPEAIGEPVLPTLDNINMGNHGGYDAVLAMTGQGIPDLENPRRPAWPDADFIIGNPPFIGGKDIRDRLGGDYAEALWQSNPRVAKSADFVMHWWDRAADELTRPGTRLKRFGLVTTNSITQVFSRRVMERYLSNSAPTGGGEPPTAVEGEQTNARDSAQPLPRLNPVAPTVGLRPPPPPEGEDQTAKLHLTLAIADHPWTRVGKDAAAVRIAMTVAQGNAASGPGEGRLVTVLAATNLDTDEPLITSVERSGCINSRLRLGEDTTLVSRLMSNLPFSVRGIEFHADGYVMSDVLANEWSDENKGFYARYVKPYIALTDLKNKRLNRYVADLYGLSERDLRQSAPRRYQHLLITAHPGRVNNRVPFRRDNWWMLALPHTELREGLSRVKSFIATGVTTKYRWYSMESSLSLPDQSLIAILLEDYVSLGILTSTIHEEWFNEHCGWLGVGNDPRYNPTRVFDTFPFPDVSSGNSRFIGELAEELQATRESIIRNIPGLTMTGLYNLVAEVRAGGALTPAREAEVVKARARIVAKLHDDLDAAVANTYGWEWPLPPGEIVARLAALNAERAAEEAAGHIRWLRPDYQRPRFAKQPTKVDPPEA